MTKKIGVKKTSNKAKPRGKGKPFQPGSPGGPGRPKGSSNRDGLQPIRSMLEDFICGKTNMQKLAEDWQKKFNMNPTGFYYKMVMPLFPKEIGLDVTDRTLEAAKLLESIITGEYERTKSKK